MTLKQFKRRSIHFQRGYESAIEAYKKEEEYEAGLPVWRRTANAYYYYGATSKQADSFEKGFKNGWEDMKRLYKGD